MPDSDSRDLDLDSSSDALVAQWARARPDIEIGTFGVLLRLRALAMLMDQLTQDAAKDVGLKPAEMYLLYAIRRGGSPYRMRPTDIFKLLRVTSGTITYRIDNLERLGLVRRIPDPEDRRSVVVELTPDGVALVDTSVDADVRRMAGPLSKVLADSTETRHFNLVLRQIGSVFDELIEKVDNPLIHAPPEDVPAPSRSKSKTAAEPAAPPKRKAARRG